MPHDNRRTQQILAVIATFAVISVNFLAAKGFINHQTPQIISDKYPTLITPAGYAFAIWSLIYFGLIVFSIYQALPQNAARYAKIRTVYILNCAANCAWIFLWHYEQILASLIVMFVLLGTLVFINVKLLKTDSPTEYWLARVPFNVYFGWITVATILNFTVALVYLSVKTSDFATSILASVLIITATLIGIIIRFKLANAVYPVTIAWALTAIAVKQSGQTTMIVVCAAFCVIVLLISALTILLQTKNQIQ